MLFRSNLTTHEFKYRQSLNHHQTSLLQGESQSPSTAVPHHCSQTPSSKYPNYKFLLLLAANSFAFLTYLSLFVLKKVRKTPLNQNILNSKIHLPVEVAGLILSRTLNIRVVPNQLLDTCQDLLDSDAALPVLLVVENAQADGPRGVDVGMW